MATPMTATQFLAQLKKWGIPYVEYKDWKTHNRNTKGAWGGVNGHIWHHTGSDGTSQDAYLYNGDTALPGPLCHNGISQDGKLHLIGWGRANHAGGGDLAVLNHVINEDYTGVLKPTKGNANGVDGNAHFYGTEIWYSGSHGMTAAQYTTALKLSAAILDFHKWTYKSVIGHGEWSNDKWDPGYASGKMMDMNAVRNDVKDVLSKVDPDADGTPGVKATTPVKPPVPAVKAYTVKKGDTVTFPGGGKVTVN